MVYVFVSRCKHVDTSLLDHTRWCPPSYKLVYNPMKTIDIPPTKTIVIGVICTNWTLSNGGTAAHLAEREGHLFRHQWCATCGAARIIHGEVMESKSLTWYDIFHDFHGICFPLLVKLDTRDFPRCSMAHGAGICLYIWITPGGWNKIWWKYGEQAERRSDSIFSVAGRIANFQRTHIFLVSSGHVYQVNVGSSMMRCSRSGLHLPSKKWQRKPRCSSLQWCYPLPVKKG